MLRKSAHMAFLVVLICFLAAQKSSIHLNSVLEHGDGIHVIHIKRPIESQGVRVLGC